MQYSVFTQTRDMWLAPLSGHRPCTLPHVTYSIYCLLVKYCLLVNQWQISSQIMDADEPLQRGPHLCAHTFTLSLRSWML